jgi:hypothetical protein
MTASQRAGHLDDLGRRPALVEDGKRHQAHLSRTEVKRLERGLALQGVLARHGGEGQRLALQARREIGGHALDVDDLHQLVAKARVELGNRFGGARAAAARRDRLADHLRKFEEHRVDVARQRQRQEPVRKAADHQQDDQEHAGVPEREPRVDRGRRLPANQQSSAFST